MRLQSKVLIVAIPASAVFAALAAFSATRLTERIMVRELSQRLAPQVESFSSRLSVPLTRGKELEILPHLQSAQEVSGAYFAEALDSKGVVMGHTNVLERGLKREDAVSIRAMTADEVQHERTLTMGEPTLLISAPIWRHEDEFLLSGGPRIRLGTLRLGLPLKPTLDSSRRLGLAVAAMAVGLCLLALVLLLVLVRMVLRPVLAVSAATARVAAGDYSAQVPVAASDEVGVLAESFNMMSHTLSQTVVSRDRLERALSVAEATMNASADGILVVGEGLKVISINDMFLGMWGIPADLAAMGDLEAMARFVLPQVEDPEVFLDIATRHSRDFLSPDRRDIIRLKDGRVFERISSPFLEAGRPAGRTITLRDLTPHYEVLAALSRARDEALEAARIKTQFLAAVSHELRTPLNAIVGAAGLLQTTKLAADQEEYAKTLSSAARALLEMVEGILDFSKLDAGRMLMEHMSLRLDAILKDAVAMVSASAAGKGLRLVADGGQAASWALLGDPMRLRQILTNLLSNAVKFTDDGEVLLQVRHLESSEQSVLLEFSVKDSGIGITEEQRARLFAPFTQADATMSRRYGGTGLGLAICKSLVELMGGEIGLESEPGQGSRFWFRLWMDRAETDVASTPAEVPASPSPVSVQVRRDHLRVLVVDDNPTNRTLILRQLGLLGCAAVAAEDGERALEHVRTDEFGLILMDCQMPGRDGLETAREIRRRESGRRRTPIVALSANATEEDRRRCLEAGMDDFERKPTTLERLAALISRWDLPYDELALAGFAAVAADPSHDLPTLLSEFVDDARSRLAAVSEGIAKSDLKACASAAHAVKGAAAAVGARGLREISRRIEAAAKGQETAEDLSGLLDQAWTQLERLAARREER